MGFVLKELAVVVAIVGLLAALAVVELSRARERSRRISCTCSLKQIGLAFRNWGGDHSQYYPMTISTNKGGALEYLERGETFRVFQLLSNELVTPKILVCPADSRLRARQFQPKFSNSNVSYFVGVISNSDFPQMFLSGDRTLTGGVLRAHGIVDFPSNSLIGWGPGLHKTGGNIGLADGSVQQFNATRIGGANRISIPY